MATNQLTVWNPQTNEYPKPDLDCIQLKNCFRCKGTRMQVLEGVQSNGVKVFKGGCLDCRELTGALPYARDAQSLGFTRIYFGRHKDKTLAEIESTTPEYLDWCLENINDVKFLGTVVLFRRTMRSGATTIQQRGSVSAASAPSRGAQWTS